MSVNQPGAAFTQTSEEHGTLLPDGSADFSIKWRVPYSQLFNYIPAPLQPHPTFPNLLYYDGEVEKEEGNVGNLILRYRGIFFSNPQAFEQVEGSISTTAEPIETAPIYAGPPGADPSGNNPAITPVPYADINTVGLALQNNTAPGAFIGTQVLKSGPNAGQNCSLNYYLKKVRGIDSFYRIGAIWKRHFSVNAVPTYTNLVGYIVTPLTSPYAPPTPPAGQNYLFAGIAWRQQGGVVTVDEEYQLSGPGGWDVDLYTYPDIA